MKKYLIFLLLLSLFSCKEKKSKTEHLKQDELISEESLMDIPNVNTVYDTIFAVKAGGQNKIINQLKSELIKSGFTFEERKNGGSVSYNNCEENKIIIVQGNGLNEYFARSKYPQKGTKNYYPDFVIWVYEFQTNEIAEQNYNIIENALHSAGSFCNGKSPDKLVINGNEVFHLATRAEMFRTYTEKYGELIIKLSNSSCQ